MNPEENNNQQPAVPSPQTSLPPVSPGASLPPPDPNPQITGPPTYTPELSTAQFTPAATLGANKDSTLDGIRKSIIKIVIIMTAISAIAVGLLFIVGASPDSTLGSTTAQENSQASFAVPVDWSEDSTPEIEAYYDAETVDNSQATYLISRPVRVSFDSEPISDREMSDLASNYRRTINEQADQNLSLSEGVEVEIEGFHLAYQFDVEGVALDGRTKIAGVSRVLLDKNNYVHTTEFIAVRSYWDANSEAIISLLDQYKLKGEK